MELQVENARLRPEDLDALIPAQTMHNTEETGERGLATDVLSAVINGASGATATAILTGVWLAWKSRRERNLQEARSTTVIVRIAGDHTNLETVLDLSGDGGEAVHALESELSQNDTGAIRRLQIIFPE